MLLEVFDFAFLHTVFNTEGILLGIFMSAQSGLMSVCVFYSMEHGLAFHMLLI